MGKVNEDHKQKQRGREKKNKRKDKLHMKRMYSSSSSLPSSARLRKVSTKDEILKKRKVRFEVPYRLLCKGCKSTFAKGLKVNAKCFGKKYHAAKVLNYYFECPCCGRKIVMEKSFEDSEYKVIKGAGRRADIGI